MNTSEHQSGRKMPLIVIAAVAILASLALAAYVVFRPATEQEFQAAVNATEAAVIPIEGMTCAACVARVRRTLSRENGVGEVEVSLQTRTATVKYDGERIQPETLADIINDLGYRAGAPAPVEASP